MSLSEIIPCAHFEINSLIFNRFLKAVSRAERLPSPAKAEDT